MNRVFVITIKKNLCPESQISFWEKIKRNSSIPNELINAEKGSVLKENILRRAFPVEKDTTFYVFLVACLKETDPNNNESNKNKTKYLVEIINQIMQDENVSKIELKHFYLIAHEKDFNESSPDIFASKLPYNDSKEKSYKLLNKLIAEKHVYLFQHDLTKCKIYSYLRKLTVFGEKEACKDILEIVGENRKMIEYFQKVDGNSDNNYTK